MIGRLIVFMAVIRVCRASNVILKSSLPGCPTSQNQLWEGIPFSGFWGFRPGPVGGVSVCRASHCVAFVSRFPEGNEGSAGSGLEGQSDNEDMEATGKG